MGDLLSGQLWVIDKSDQIGIIHKINSKDFNDFTFNAFCMSGLLMYVSVLSENTESVRIFGRMSILK